MRTGNIGLALMLVEIDGKLHQVRLPQDRYAILVQLAASLADDGKLPVTDAPAHWTLKQE